MARYANSARCFLVRKRSGSPVGGYRTGYPMQRRCRVASMRPRRSWPFENNEKATTNRQTLMRGALFASCTIRVQGSLYQVNQRTSQLLSRRLAYWSVHSAFPSVLNPASFCGASRKRVRPAGVRPVSQYCRLSSDSTSACFGHTSSLTHKGSAGELAGLAEPRLLPRGLAEAAGALRLGRAPRKGGQFAWDGPAVGGRTHIWVGTSAR